MGTQHDDERHNGRNGRINGVDQQVGEAKSRESRAKEQCHEANKGETGDPRPRIRHDENRQQAGGEDEANLDPAQHRNPAKQIAGEDRFDELSVNLGARHEPDRGLFRVDKAHPGHAEEHDVVFQVSRIIRAVQEIGRRDQVLGVGSREVRIGAATAVRRQK